MSINKSQAAALAEGFLDDIGSGDKSDLQPRETLSELFLLAGELVEQAQDNLGNSNASGKLSESIVAEEPIVTGNTIRVDISMLFYGQFINKGVQGTKSGSGPFAFKYDKPSAKMVKNLLDYIKTSGKKITNTSNKSVSQNEIKNRTVSEISSAYAFGRSIVQKGIRKTSFMDKAIKTTADKVEDRFQAALNVDIINSLPDSL